MPLLTLDEVSLAFGPQVLLQRVDFQIERGERVCLLGRNGAGKSTMLKLISGHLGVDEGVIWHPDTLRISHLLQEVPADEPRTVYEVVAAGLGALGRSLQAYHEALLRLDAGGKAELQQLDELQRDIEVAGGWNLEQKIETVLDRLSLPADKPMPECSGGIRRRVMLAQALVSEPDLLLLDEPTNHMDIAAIRWLEDTLRNFGGAVLFITHDRTLVRQVATRIVELDRGTLSSYPGDYDSYLEVKAARLAAEQRAEARFDKALCAEEAWIRQGIKARRTRNEGRVRRLLAMREARRQRLARDDKLKVDLDAAALSGKLVADLREVSFSYGDHCVLRDFSSRVLRGDRVGIIGANGSGKSTLLRLMLGELKPDRGSVVLGSKLEIAYFDQQREQLDAEKTVRENISGGTDYVSVGARSRHVIGYLKDFLFPPEQIDVPVKVLSGGERNRLLLARVFTRSANLLVLDEPTNDLDVDTLELLEELLCDFDGTLLLVSHDRAFLDNIVTSTIAFEGAGRALEYVGGYEDWLRQRGAPLPEPATAAHRSPRPGRRDKPGRTRKLGYREQRELDALPDRIEALERELAELQERTAEAAFFRQDRTAIQATLARQQRLQGELSEAYARWERLDR